MVGSILVTGDQAVGGRRVPGIGVSMLIMVSAVQLQGLGYGHGVGAWA